MMDAYVSYTVCQIYGRSCVLPFPACRYTTKPLMQELFKAVVKHWREEHFGKEDCAKFFVDRGGCW